MDKQGRAGKMQEKQWKKAQKSEENEGKPMEITRETNEQQIKDSI